ncbi:THO complex subunit 4D [Zea mays]|uniref:THO complex subunit 4C n=2 Tax=Zea mays TaxID=4577 RepID=A0A1D6Q1B7_MAIZE|nr:THO complex subunit 4C [Zea mays]AQK52404.1 THO complex subunit 4C [Zea mays]AQK52406.1 THO complex subunit 4C [Zea mays]AQK52409.1 THO complex subunit 4C [Zea mays]PWZ29153.1 THO complex subunit 4D [Zea mays]
MFGIFQSFSRTKDMTWRPDLFSDSMAASGIETGTKLYISNLDYGVSNEDIKGTAEVVFTRRSDAIAALKRYNNVLLDGKAMKIEVIGNDLGLPMTPRINVVGASNGRATRTVVMTPEFSQRGRGSSSRPLSLFDLVLTHDLTYCRSSNPSNRFNNRGGFQAGRGRGQFQSWGRGRGQFQSRGRGRAQFQGRGRGRKPEKTADELDKDLESYHAEAMKTD